MSSIFNTTFSSTKVKEISYNPQWENGTGYLDHAVKGERAPELGHGEMVKAQSPAYRKIIIIGTQFGNFVVFQRYVGDETRITFNCPIEIESLFGSTIERGLLEEKTMDLILGEVEWSDIRPNIGTRISRFTKSVETVTKTD